MAAEHPDPKSLWLDQEPETDAMTLDQIHALAGRYDRKVRFLPLMIGVCLVGVGLLGGVLWSKMPDTLGRVSAVLFILGEATCFILGYRLAFPRRDPAESAGAYLRRRLQLKLTNAQGGWMVMLAPLLPFLLLTIYRMALHPPAHHGPTLLQFAPVAVLAALWLIVFLIQRGRAARSSKAELEELDALMRR
jgi:hypothetical protein